MSWTSLSKDGSAAQGTELKPPGREIGGGCKGRMGKSISFSPGPDVDLVGDWR